MSDAVPMMLWTVAVAVPVPAVAPVANPATIVARPGGVTPQAAEVVRLSVDPSLYVPVAVNCWLRPAATEADGGDTLTEISTAGVTEIEAEPLTVPEAAVMLVVPTAAALTSPADTVATVGDEDVHVALAVKSLVVLSE